MPKRPCLTCGTLTTGTRCPAHERANHQAAYGGRWRRLSARQRRNHPSCQCTGCTRHDGPCRATTDLTADHLRPHALGGTADDGIRTLCRSCNSARKDRPSA